jgi:hypothetical protein
VARARSTWTARAGARIVTLVHSCSETVVAKGARWSRAERRQWGPSREKERAAGAMLCCGWASLLELTTNRNSYFFPINLFQHSI